MNYKDTLLKLLSGISNDNAVEIEKACHTFLAITGVVSVEESERELAAHLTKRAADVCHESPSKTHSWYGSSQGYVCEHCGTRR